MRITSFVEGGLSRAAPAAFRYSKNERTTERMRLVAEVELPVIVGFQPHYAVTLEAFTSRAEAMRDSPQGDALPPRLERLIGHLIDARPSLDLTRFLKPGF